ncbi:porin family protein [Aquicoccus porphyridii]|uniref:porin family protein n=1 Tax=Aquicoccus porphyridii TaxID=1852029 RepID=UPI00273FA158|nr:porin family protein [Aquicoccus porphyridii]
MRHILRLALVLGLTWSPTAWADERAALSPGDMRLATIVAIEAGDTARARALTDALLARDPHDIEALLLAARAHRDAGQAREAQTHARRAWSVARAPRERHAAALAMAQALASSDQRTRAQFWLRRAAHHAPNERLRQAAVRDFRYVRQRNPLSVQLRFGITPKSNVNNGSANSTIDIFGLPDVNLTGAARALSGLEVMGGAALRYRVAETPSRATDLTFNALRRDYRLSSEARRIAPTARGSDFAFAAISAGVTQRFMQLDTRRETTLSAALGKTWYGGSPYSDFARLSVGHTMPLSRVSRLDVKLTGERTRGPAAPHADLLRAQASYTRVLSNRGQIGLSLQLTDSRASHASADFTEVATRLSYAPPQPILGVKTSFGLGLRARDYPATPYRAGARRDREASADMTMAFDRMDYLGFTPTLTLSTSRTDSNVGLFDVENLGLALGLRSAF